MENRNHNSKKTGSPIPAIIFSLLITLLVFVLVVMIWPSVYVSLHTYDLNALKALNLHRAKSLDPFFLLLTNTSSMVSLAITASTLSIAWIRKSIRLKLTGLQLLVTFLSSFIVIKTMKVLIGRERPYISYHFLTKIAQAESLSFPSGHTFEAFAYATGVALAFKNRWATGLIFTWAALVGFSRLVLGMHYPSDVLGGIIFGIFTGYFVHILYRKNIAQ